MQQHLINGYGKLYYEKYLSHECIQSGIKEELVDPMLLKIKEECLRRLSATPEDRQSLEQQIGDIFDVHCGIETVAKEDSRMRASLAPVVPVRRQFIDTPDAHGKATGSRTGDFCYDMPFDKELADMLNKDDDLLQKLRSASDSWAAEGPSPGETRTIYCDIPDGEVMRTHPGLTVAQEGSDASLAVILYYDDLEVCNPLGAFHGIHKLGMFYWALVNIEPESRMAFHNMHLMTVALASDINYYGIKQTVSGLPGDTSFGSAMTALDQGMDITLSNGTAVRLHGWCILLSADFPAAALCCGFKQSTSAAHFCRGCDCDKKEDVYPCPNSFLEANSDLEAAHLLRTHDEYLDQYAEFQAKPTAKARKAFLTSIGLNTFTDHAFTRVPHFDVCRYVPFDFMHCEAEGTLKAELAHMLYHFIRQRPGWGFTLEAVNRRMRQYAWPGGHQPQPFTSGYLEKGTKDGLSKKGSHVHMTAGDMVHSCLALAPCTLSICCCCLVAQAAFLCDRRWYDTLCLTLYRCAASSHQGYSRSTMAVLAGTSSIFSAAHATLYLL